jgi:hypothetical protein
MRWPCARRSSSPWRRPARPHRWTLIPERPLEVRGKTVRPDGTFRDEWHLPVGYWEAKDTDDDLNAEIRSKIARVIR